MRKFSYKIYICRRVSKRDRNLQTKFDQNKDSASYARTAFEDTMRNARRYIGRRWMNYFMRSTGNRSRKKS